MFSRRGFVQPVYAAFGGKAFDFHDKKCGDSICMKELE